MSRSSASVVIVGAAAAGLATAQALRQKGFEGRLTMVGEERHLPYDRPPLSKQVLSGEWEPARITLRSEEAYRDLDVELRLGTRAEGVDLVSRTVRLATHDAISYDRLVIATGVTPQQLSHGHDLAGVHVLRGLDDTIAVRASLAQLPSVVIVGGGFLGSELAATARKLGLDVTMVYPESYPLELQLGRVLGGVVARMHEDHGVRLRPRTMVSRLLSSNGRVTGVRFVDGAAVVADVVLVCIGSTPATRWLTGSGLTLSDGVVCDEFGRAAHDVYAVGDVASWRDVECGRQARREHRSNASEHGVAVASHIVGEAKAFRSVPFFWTDQHDARIQVHGSLPAGGQLAVVEGSLAERRFVSLWGFDGQVVGAIGWNLPKAVRRAREHVVARAPFTGPRDLVGSLGE
jgi:3-phenylpropionate/trans-cinnamate dioxygenase ferredoxin reductase component